jgi:hypothetical protein
MGVCARVKPDSNGCKAQLMKRQSWCYAHHPDLSHETSALSSDPRCGKIAWKRPDNRFYRSQKMALHLSESKSTKEDQRA